jgi:hypothetical protein
VNQWWLILLLSEVITCAHDLWIEKIGAHWKHEKMNNRLVVVLEAKSCRIFLIFAKNSQVHLVSLCKHELEP